MKLFEVATNNAETNEIHKIWKYFPIIMIGTFYLICYLLFRYGIWKWPSSDDSKVLIFMAFVIFFSVMGFFLAEKFVVKKKKTVAIKFNINLILAVCCVFGAILYVPTSYLYTNAPFPPFWSAIFNLGDMYRQYALSQYASTSFRWWGVFDVLVYAILPLTYYYFDEIHVVNKWIGSILSVLYLLIYVSSGKNMPVFVCMVASVVVCLVLLFAPKNRGKIRKKVFIILFEMVLVLATVFLFGKSLQSRTFYTPEKEEQVTVVQKENEDETKAPADEEVKTEEEIEREQTQLEKYEEVKAAFAGYVDDYSKAYVDLNAPMLEVLPNQVHFLYIIGTKYLTNGFHGMSVAMDMGTEWTYGVGRSPFLRSCANRIFGVDVTDMVFEERMEAMETQLVNPHAWRTAFTDLANDFTFPGVVAVMAVICFFVNILWNDCLTGRNPFAMLLLGYITLQLLYMPAGWIIEFSGGMAVQLYLLIVMWIASKVLEKVIERKRNGITTNAEDVK